MKENIKDYEIMAPVGSRDSLAAALKAGAWVSVFRGRAVEHALTLRQPFYD